jgi:hypothetical protein
MGECTTVLRCFTGMRHGHHLALHQCQEGKNLSICGRPANLRGLQGRRAEEGITTTTVVVEIEDEPGQREDADGANE